MIHRSDLEWERFGKEDPYFGVLTIDKFHGELSAESKAEFFRDGEEYIKSVFRVIERRFREDFTIERALDFGCGVGRIAIPLASRADSVLGIDISPSMLAEAEKNCREQKISNVKFELSDELLTRVIGEFDFVHSVLVFQHIGELRGLEIFSHIVARLKSNGIGVIQFVYRWSGKPKSLVQKVRELVPAVDSAINLLRGRVARPPRMDMNAYDIGSVLLILEELGVKNIFCELIRMGEWSGVIVYISKE